MWVNLRYHYDFFFLLLIEYVFHLLWWLGLVGILRNLILGFRRSGTWGIVPSSRLDFNVTWVLLISKFNLITKQMELPQTNADEADEDPATTQNPWFLHSTNKPVVHHKLSPCQGMPTHKIYFLFCPNYFHSISSC